jgi:hypothetical protein
MTGNNLQNFDEMLPLLEPVEVQFSKALKDDNSLFVEEEQNLFIDEVREANLWSRAFEEKYKGVVSKSDTDIVWRDASAALATWVIDGLAVMTGLLKKEDGPLGWMSKPAVFSSSMRVLLSAKAIIQRHGQGVKSAQKLEEPIIKDINSALERFSIIGQDKNTHQSVLVGMQGIHYLPPELC